MQQELRRRPGWVVRLLWAAVVVIVVGPTFASLVRTAPGWNNDGFMYVRMMLVDRGMSEEQAYASAGSFYLARPHVGNHASPDLFGTHPPRFFVTQYALFRARKLYPWLASLLYPRFGMDALLIVSAASVTLAAAAIYGILLFAAPPWLAALGAIAAAGYPLVRGVGSFAGTDGPALLAWSICLAATIAFARTRGSGWLGVAVVAAALLAVTRPAIWLPPGAAAGLFVYASIKRDRPIRAAATRLLIAQAVVAVAALGYTAAQHGAGFFDLLKWQYDLHVYEHGHWVQYGIGGWYLIYVLRGFVVEPISLLADGAPVLALAAAAIGLWRRRADAVTAVLLGGAAVAPLAIFANPPDFGRALELPLVPVVMFGLVALIADGVRAGRSAKYVAAG